MDPDSLPKYEEVTFRSLPARSVIPGLVRAVVTASIFYGIFSFILALPEVTEVDPIFLSLADWGRKLMPSFAVFLMIVALLRYWHRGYAIRDHDILYKWGIIRRWRTILPINRIQHLETHRSLPQRPLGLASLLLYSAGGSSADLAIPGLELEMAYTIRDMILKRIHAESEQGVEGAERTGGESDG